MPEFGKLCLIQTVLSVRDSSIFSFQTLAGAILFGARYVPMSSFGLLLRGWDSAVDVRALSRAVGMTSEME